MDIFVRKATIHDIDKIECLYDDLNDYLAEHENGPRWKKGVYPVREHAEEALRVDSLYVAVSEEKIVGTVEYSREQGEVYKEVDWQIEFDVPVFIICKLAVHPQYLRCGVAQSLLNYAAVLGKKNGIKALRLDTYEENISAMKLYEKCGFKYMGVIDLGLEEVYGLKWYKVYEKLI